MNTDFERELADTVRALPDRWKMLDPVLRQHVHVIHDWLTETPPPREAGVWLQVRGIGEPHWLAVADGLAIGRSDGCDLVVRNAWISGRHCRFVQRDEDWLLEDLGSSNGTFVNGRKLPLHILREGDVVQLNELRLLFLRTESDDNTTATGVANERD